MAEDIKISPTPIQRNPLDVATELTLRYFQSFNPKSVEDMQDVFSRFFAVTNTLGNTHPKYLKSLLPADLLKKISE